MSDRGKNAFVVVGLGELLWDMLPAGKQVGGAPANFAWHARQLGARSVVASAVGDDALGRELRASAAAMDLDDRHLAVVADKPTSTVSVALDDHGKPSYVIHENVAWDFIPCTPGLLELAKQADGVCVGTLAQRSPTSRQTIQRFLDAVRPDCLRVYDVNLRQHYYSREVIERTLAKCQVFKFNDEEWPILADMLGVSADAPVGMTQLQESRNLRVIAMTRGGAGSLLCSADGLIHCPAPRVQVADTVGAGDAFTAALTLGLLCGEPLSLVHRRASELAGYVCTQHGGTPVLPEAFRSPQ